jgi:phage baseplate assembly protein W
MSMADLDFPYRFDAHGRTASAAREDHVRDLIEQVLMTAPGERVMRPDFGSGLLGLVFEPNSTVLAATTQMLVQAALQQHLGHLLLVKAVEVDNSDAALRVEVQYVLLRDQTTHSVTFAPPGAVP